MVGGDVRSLGGERIRLTATREIGARANVLSPRCFSENDRVMRFLPRNRKLLGDARQVIGIFRVCGRSRSPSAVAGPWGHSEPDWTDDSA
jgi:hypothetical protein